MGEGWEAGGIEGVEDEGRREGEEGRTEGWREGGSRRTLMINEPTLWYHLFPGNQHKSQFIEKYDASHLDRESLMVMYEKWAIVTGGCRL